ncbi:hypothetical protein QUA62_26110 [Microcoleus sp. MON1_C1]|uniref:hypothetical protein n=1 Tax=Microcoleus sp. MON1_C1 TaxID=2818827 RepID=UPI002FD39CDE
MILPDTDAAQPGDTIVVYATLPEGKAIGTVKVVRHESLTVDRLWRESEQGKLAKVSWQQFDAYYTNQESGIGVWVSAPELFPSQIALPQLRQNFGQRWQPP